MLEVARFKVLGHHPHLAEKLYHQRCAPPSNTIGPTLRALWPCCTSRPLRLGLTPWLKGGWWEAPPLPEKHPNNGPDVPPS